MLTKTPRNEFAVETDVESLIDDEDGMNCSKNEDSIELNPSMSLNL